MTATVALMLDIHCDITIDLRTSPVAECYDQCWFMVIIVIAGSTVITSGLTHKELIIYPCLLVDELRMA